MTLKKHLVYGSHNTMTYLPVKNWWLFPGLLIAKCQKRDYIEQFNRGARVFDLRIYFSTKSRRWEFAHGLIDFKSKETLSLVVWRLAQLKKTTQDDVYVRIILEKWTSESQCHYFSEMCAAYELQYPRLKFIGGNRKGDWKKLYTFMDDVPDTLNNQWVSSMAEDARWYEKAFPFLYALRMNKKNRLKMKEKLNLFDFV